MTAPHFTVETDAFIVRLSNDLRHVCKGGSTLEIDNVGGVTATDPEGREWMVTHEGWLDIAFVGDRAITDRRHAQRRIR